MPDSNLSPDLRRTLLLKIISNKEPKPEDVDSVIELTAGQILDLLEAQALTVYLVQGGNIHFKYIYYSDSLYQGSSQKEKEFEERKKTLHNMSLPMGTGMVGRVIEEGRPVFYSLSKQSTRPMFSVVKDTGFDVTCMITVPLVGSRCIGAIQVLNKEPGAFSREFRRDDLRTLEEVAEYCAPLIQRSIDPNYQIDDEQLARFTSIFTGSPLILSEGELDIDGALVEVTGAEIVSETNVFPYKQISPTRCSVLMTNPFDYTARETFEQRAQMAIDDVAVVPRNLLETLIAKHFETQQTPQVDLSPAGESEFSELVDVLGAEYEKTDVQDGGFESEESAPIIALANRIVEDAYVAGASDIHIEPQENDLLVRYRVDGVCAEKLRLPKELTGALVARFKIMSELDIAEKRLPQDGRIVFKKYTKRPIDIDLRVATAPMNFGEKMVMRILDKTKSALPITALGFSEDNLGTYRECIRQPYGMILHCGPTGSGKSMTLFSALREVAKPDVNIQTAEDPIEYTIPGINQMQMHKQIGLTFARALRSFLRMDPDVILVGEIRDQETAEIAVEAALTGHLLLSTLHTNDAPSTVARLTEMGIEPFMVSASLLVVCAQRLERRVCKQCREEYMPEGNELELLTRAWPDWTPEPVYRASSIGCRACGGTGMKGRVGIHELMRNNDKITHAINEAMETSTIKKIAMATGMKTLHQDSMLKVIQKTSTVLEGVSTVPPDLTPEEIAEAKAMEEAAAKQTLEAAT